MAQELTAEKKAEIDAMTTEDMLRKWRFAPMGTFRANDPADEYFTEELIRRKELDPSAWVAASKAVGW